MKIVVLNRLHLDEWPSDQVARILESLRDHPEITSFTRQALAPSIPKRRGHNANITQCFPGDSRGNAEERDARRITRLCRGSDLVLDIHGNNNAVGSDHPFYGAASRDNPLVMGVASLLGSRHGVVYVDGPHPAVTLANYVGWDLSPNTTALGQLSSWLVAIAEGWVPATRRMREYRPVGEVLAEDGRRLGLKRVYPDFARLPDDAAKELGFPLPAFASCWNADLVGHTGYWGEVSTIFQPS